MTAQNYKHFTITTDSEGNKTIEPKNEKNKVLEKKLGYLDWNNCWENGTIPQIEKARIIPFQELIDEGVFSSQRMKHLRQYANSFYIIPYMDETGIISYVSFFATPQCKDTLTDAELLAICNKYKGVRYDLSKVYVIKRPGGGTKESFYSSDFFNIPFQSLKY